MTPNSIKALIALRGQRQVDVAAEIRAHGIKCSAEELNQTIHGDRVNQDIRDALEEILGMQGKLFDEEFEAVLGLRRSA